MKRQNCFIAVMVLAVLILPAALFAGGSTEKTDGSGPIYFAWVGPLTGNSKQYGDTEKAAVEIALEDIKAAGGVLGGREILVDYYDDKNDATEAVNIANKIIGAGKYSAIIGHFSSTPAMAAAPIYNDGELLMYSPTASHADFSSLGDYIFRNTATQALETAAYADYTYNKLGIRSVAILNVNDDWGNNIAKIFTETFEKLGGKIILTENFIPNQTKDFTPMIAKVKQANPEAFFPVCYYAESAQILIQMDSLDYKPKLTILSSSALKQELIDVAGKLADGCFLMNAFTPDIPGTDFTRVMKAYKDKTGKEGDAFLMQTYDVVCQLAVVITQANSADPKKMRPVLAGMKNYPSLAGPYNMNEIGDAMRTLQPIMIENGKFVNISSR
ncbi:MAG: ABC transporter substrate-binding protein [Spirochaetaceae bacterium]|jgi:branched-chain amino acid transport system substrate-binding protein|nr:ABC transporter substrate-binding protein [Spirochaetaceae bacterium]